MPESTFTKFTPAQAAAYASGRGHSYPPAVYDEVLTYHDANNKGVDGTHDLVLDIGTGPGKVVYDLLPFFQRGIGVDPGAAMINAARNDARYAAAGEGNVRFEVAGAEICGELEGVAGRVDLATVAMAAHWFNMPAFYASAAKALKPGGTLAMWTCSSMYAHPSDPDHKELQAILSHLEDDMLAPYLTPGNQLSRNRYLDLPLPWTLEEPIAAFEESSFVRRDWDHGGIPSAPKASDGTPGDFLFTERVTPARLGKGLGAASMVVRWRDAHKDALAKGEIEDCVALTVRRLQEVLKDRSDGTFPVAPSCTVLLMTRV